MAVSPELMEWLAERFAPLGPVHRKRLFGGMCFYLDDAMFAAVLRDTLYFKCDDDTAAAFDAAGCEPFEYDKQGGTTVVPAFRRCPDSAMDDEDELLDWARLGIEAGRRTAIEKAKKAARKKAKKK